jgi:hypothetical protein
VRVRGSRAAVHGCHEIGTLTLCGAFLHMKTDYILFPMQRQVTVGGACVLLKREPDRRDMDDFDMVSLCTQPPRDANLEMLAASIIKQRLSSPTDYDTKPRNSRPVKITCPGPVQKPPNTTIYTSEQPRGTASHWPHARDNQSLLRAPPNMCNQISASRAQPQTCIQASLRSFV